MNIVRNILAIVGGLVGGGIVNYAIIVLGHALFPLEGYEPNNMESLAVALESATPMQFAMPFFAHALGTLVGALIAYIIAGISKKVFAWVIGFFYLINGSYMVITLDTPLWFNVLDLVIAYLPMSYLAIFIGKKIQPAN